jgi:hypothetical protein
MSAVNKNRSLHRQWQRNASWQASSPIAGNARLLLGQSSNA